MNKTIYMTYKRDVPDYVFSRWKLHNPEYTIEFSLNEDCEKFIETHFNTYVSELFKSISKGAYKADLWRLCKLYIYGGIYADIDLIPHITLDNLNKDITLYSCLSIDNGSIFQAFMASFSKPRSPLILNFLLSFLLNNPQNGKWNGPTFDMYNCVKYNLNGEKIVGNKIYSINEIKIPVKIGPSDTQTKLINLHYFPEGHDYTIRLIGNKYGYKDEFEFSIKDNILTVKRKDLNQGWGFNHSCEVCIRSDEKILLFQEISKGRWQDSYVVDGSGNKILDSRDPEYCQLNGYK